MRLIGRNGVQRGVPVAARRRHFRASGRRAAARRDDERDRRVSGHRRPAAADGAHQHARRAGRGARRRDGAHARRPGVMDGRLRGATRARPDDDAPLNAAGRVCPAGLRWPCCRPRALRRASQERRAARLWQGVATGQAAGACRCMRALRCRIGPHGRSRPAALDGRHRRHVQPANFMSGLSCDDRPQVHVATRKRRKQWANAKHRHLRGPLGENFQYPDAAPACPQRALGSPWRGIRCNRALTPAILTASDARRAG